MSDDPIPPEIREKMNRIAKRLGEAVGPNHCFALLVFDRNKPRGGRASYISNGTRESMQAALRELLAHWDGRRADAPERLQ